MANAAEAINRIILAIVVTNLSVCVRVFVCACACQYQS